MQERKLIDLCQKGQLNYFGELYDRYVDQIYKFIYLKTYDTHISEDLTSQVFFQALDKIHSFDTTDPNANFRAWLYRIAYNLVIDYYKKAPQDIGLEEVPEFSIDESFGDDVDNKEILKQVFAYFDTLKPKFKDIVLMRIWEDLSYKEISEISGESIANCKKIVSRALQNIPEHIKTL